MGTLLTFVVSLAALFHLQWTNTLHTRPPQLGVYKITTHNIVYDTDMLLTLRKNAQKLLFIKWSPIYVSKAIQIWSRPMEAI